MEETNPGRQGSPKAIALRPGAGRGRSDAKGGHLGAKKPALNAGNEYLHIQRPQGKRTQGWPEPCGRRRMPVGGQKKPALVSFRGRIWHPGGTSRKSTISILWWILAPGGPPQDPLPKA
eukprot:gene14045-biopygen2044